MGERMETVQAEVMVQDEQTVVHNFFVVSSRKLKKSQDLLSWCYIYNIEHGLGLLVRVP